MKSHTRFAHVADDGNYAIQNECSLMFGESTASATFPAVALGNPNGTALFCVNELTRVASERACSAREAIELMGGLAEQHGFFGADGGAGEVLMVGDTTEAWVFHILSDPTGKGAIWVAQRVPDDHVAVVANMFSIREVDPDDTRNFLMSKSVHAVARQYGLWSSADGLLDFTKTYSAGEYGAKYYSGRRVWDGYRRMKPSLLLPAEYGSLKQDRPYPFSVPLLTSERLDVHDWFAAHRSHYEGTPYDLSKGLAAGPFGTPDRYGTSDPHGAWPRSVAIYRSAMTWVVQANAGLSEPHRGTVWLGPADSSKTIFVPLIVTAGEPPRSYTVGNPAKLDRSSAYWAHRYVQNLAQLRYSEMIVDIQNASAHWERRAAHLVESIRSGIEPMPKQALDAHAARVLAAAWRLADELMVKYADGGLTSLGADGGSPRSVDLSYPSDWLARVGYGDGVRYPPPGGWDGGAEPPLVGPGGPSVAANTERLQLLEDIQLQSLAATRVAAAPLPRWSSLASAKAAAEPAAAESSPSIVSVVLATSALTTLVLVATAAAIGVRFEGRAAERDAVALRGEESVYVAFAS